MSFPDYTGNSKALYEYLKRSRKNLKLVWIVFDKNTLEKLRDRGIKSYYYPSAKGILEMFTARIIFVTHSTLYFEWKNRKQFLISLWHGHGIKSGIPVSKTFYNFSKRIDYAISTSQLSSLFVIHDFLIEPGKVLVTGLPRYDNLFDYEKSYEKLGRILRYKGVSLKDYKYVVFYLPTFREGLSSRKEGFSFDDYPNIFRVMDYDSGRVSNFLKKYNILLIVKFHPIEEKIVICKKIEIPENVILLTDDDLKGDLLDLYDVLGACDILITDYSSVYVDYLILNRPIIFLVPDLEIYRVRRGFVLEPFEYWTPGEKVRNMNDLLLSLEKIILGNDEYRNHREVLIKIFHKYRDDKNCERVWRHCERIIK